MKKTEVAKIIAEFVMASEETIIEAYEQDDIRIVEDEAFEYLNNCDYCD